MANNDKAWQGDGSKNKPYRMVRTISGDLVCALCGDWPIKEFEKQNVKLEKSIKDHNGKQ